MLAGTIRPIPHPPVFKELLNAYEREPTLANYVRFRRMFGVSGTDVARSTQFDPFEIEAELRQFRGVALDRAGEG
jgi:hypothetical protein